VVIVRHLMTSASKDFVDRIEKVSQLTGVTERELCRLAGIKSTSQIAAARSRGSKLNWDHVSALASLLIRAGFAREWVLFGEGFPVPLGGQIRLGADSGDVKVARIPKAKQSGKHARGSTSDNAPAARKHGSRL
jgi:hypothetical protein